MNSFQKAFSLLLIITLIFQVSSFQTRAQADELFVIKEGKLEEDLITEEFQNELLWEPEYIQEHLIYENEIYEYKIGEQLTCEAFVYETTITPNTITNLISIFPPQFDEYNIDWPSVIAKFAIGTTIIIAVGIVNHVVKGSSFFIMASPVSVAKDAFIGGAIGASLNVVIHDVSEGYLTDRAVTKYAVEGFAEGYMWGAITSVLKVSVKNIKRLQQFRKATGGILKIKLNGEVLDQSGKIIGKAYYDSSKLWHLVNEAANTTTIFDSAGKELMTTVGTSLPANKILKLGSDSAAHICRTDASGIIYRIDDTLQPNISYKLGDNIYFTDSKGRIISVEFDNLMLKDPERPRLFICDSMKVIGKKSAKLSDQRGHLIADLFDGDNTMANIVPQSGKVNQGIVKEIESGWAEAIREGKKVSGSIQISYKGNSFRPSSFTYTYDSGSGLVEKIIPNK